MKKQLFSYLIVQIVLLMLLPLRTKAQAIPLSHIDSLDYIFIFPDTVMNPNFYKLLLTARELGYTTPSKARLWRIPKTLQNTINDTTISYSFNDSIAAIGEIKRKVKSAGFGDNKQLFRVGINRLQNDTIGSTLCQYAQERADLTLLVRPQRDSIKIGIFDSGVHRNFQGAINHKWNFIAWNDTVTDDNGHGNFVSNIIDGQLHSSVTKYSVFKILDSQGGGYLFDVIRAIDTSIKLKLDVCNLSITTIQAMSFDTIHILNTVKFVKTPLQIAMDSAAAHQVMLVIAAGNESKDLDTLYNNRLATYTTASAIKVLGVNCTERLADYSNFGKQQVDIGAYSENVISRGLNNQIDTSGGTSFATAKVTSAVAKLLLAMPPSNYQATDCKNALLRGSRYLPNLQDKCTSEGIVNLNQAWRNLNLYALTLENATCNNTDTLWLKLRMKTPRPCIDALTAYIDFDSTQMIYIPNKIKKGDAVPNSGVITEALIGNQRIFIMIDLGTSCIRGDSDAWILSIPFLWNTNAVRPNIIGSFQLTLKEERESSSRDTTHQSNHTYQVIPANLTAINIENNVRNIPLSIELGNACNALSLPRNITQNRYQVRRDSFSHFELNCKPLDTMPLVRGYDAFMMYHKDSFRLTPTQRIAADVNYDNNIGNGDIITLLRRAILVYRNLHEYSGNRLTSDCLFVKDTNFTDVNRCYAMDNPSQATCDIATIPMKIIEIGNVKNIDNYTFNNNTSIYIDVCKKVRVANEWKIPIYSNAIVHSVDIHFPNITIAPNLLRIESANPLSFPIESNGIGQNFYVIGYSKQYQGNNATDTIAYLYVKTPNFYPQYLGSITSYQDTQRVNNYIKDICTNTNETDGINIKLFPNPCRDHLNISFTTPTTNSKEGNIYNLLGMCLHTFSIEPNITKLTIDTKNIGIGTLILSIEDFKTKIIKY